MDVELPALADAIVAHGYEQKVADEVIEIVKPFVGYGLTY